jgi:hypothetical protein
MATGALNTPYYYTAKHISKVNPIKNVDDLVEHSLNMPLNLKSKPYKPSTEEAAIMGFVKKMGPDLTGPNFNQPGPIEELAKRAKTNMFPADEQDTKSITESLLKDEDKEEEEKLAAGAMDKSEREAKNNITISQNTTFEDVGVSKDEMKTKLNKETEEIDEEMAKDLKDSCSPAAPLQVILKKAEVVVPKPPPPPPPKPEPRPESVKAPIVIPKKIKIDERLEIEKAYDRAATALKNDTEKEEKMEEEHKGKISEIANQTLQESSIEKEENEKKEEIQEKNDKKKLDIEESKKIGAEIKKKIKEV